MEQVFRLNKIIQEHRPPLGTVDKLTSSGKRLDKKTYLFLSNMLIFLCIIYSKNIKLLPYNWSDTIFHPFYIFLLGLRKSTFFWIPV
jgi:hypothetical protein